MDAALTGPHQLDRSEAVTVLGVSKIQTSQVQGHQLLFKMYFLQVSENTVDRVGMMASQMEAREVNRKVERGRQLGRSSRVDERTRLGMSNGTRRPNNLSQHTAHERSHQRSHSAQSVTSSPEKTGVAGVKDGTARHLASQFDAYSKLGDRRSDGSHITSSQSDKWLKQVL